MGSLWIPGIRILRNPGATKARMRRHLLSKEAEHEAGVYLIDTPQDADLAVRQNMWSYHRNNRGARNQKRKTSLPSIPYRFQPTPQEQEREIRPKELINIHGPTVKLPKLGSKQNLFNKLNGMATPPASERLTSKGSTEVSDLNVQLSLSINNLKSNLSTENVSNKGLSKNKGHSRSRSQAQNNKKANESNIVLPELPSNIFQDKRNSIKKNLEPRNISSANTEREEELPVDVKNAPKSIIPKIENSIIESDRETIYSESFYETDESLSRICKQMQPTPLTLADLLQKSSPKWKKKNNLYGASYNKYLESVSRRTIAGNSPRSTPIQQPAWYEQFVGQRDLVDVSSYDNFARTKFPPLAQSGEKTGQSNITGKRDPLGASKQSKYLRLS